MTVQIATLRGSTGFVHRAGILCLWAGLLGAASGIYLAVVPPAVDPGRYSFPLDSLQFVLIQLWFAVQHIGLILGLLGLQATGAAGSGRAAGIGHVAAVAGMALLTLAELVAIGAAGSSAPTPLISLLDVGYGLSILMIGVGLVMVGLAVLRRRQWQGWRRYLPLLLGVYVFFPMTPAIAGPFVAARLAITGWMLLFAALGWALMQGEDGA